MFGYDDLTELHDFGRVLVHEIRDRAIRELFDRLTGSSDGTPSDQSLGHLSSSADAAAVRDVIVTAVDGAIAGFLFVMDDASMREEDSKFEIFSPAGKSLARVSDGIHAELFGPQGWITRYSEFPE